MGNQIIGRAAIWAVGSVKQNLYAGDQQLSAAACFFTWQSSVLLPSSAKATKRLRRERKIAGMLLWYFIKIPFCASDPLSVGFHIGFKGHGSVDKLIFGEFHDPI